MTVDENTDGGVEGKVMAIAGERGWGVEGPVMGLLATIKSEVVSLSLVGDGGLTEIRLAQIKRCAPLVVLSGEF